MKKLLVFTLVVSMLAVAGVAFADDLNPHPNPVTPDVPAANVPSASNVANAVSTVTDDQVSETKTKYSSEISEAQSQYAASAGVATGVSASEENAVTSTSGLESATVVKNGVTTPSNSEVSDSFAKGTAAVVNAAASSTGSASNQPTVKSPAGVPDVDPLQAAGLAALVPYQRLVVKISFDIAGMKTFKPNSFYFFPQRQSLDLVGAAGDMSLVYQSGDAVYPLGASNINSPDNAASVFLVMNYNGATATGGLGTTSFDASSDTIIKTLKPMILAVSSTSDSSKTITVPETVVPSTPGGDDEPTTHALGGSGGGCVAGTSVLALAVLGVFLAKRRG